MQTPVMRQPNISARTDQALGSIYTTDVRYWPKVDIVLLCFAGKRSSVVHGGTTTHKSSVMHFAGVSHDIVMPRMVKWRSETLAGIAAFLDAPDAPSHSVN